MRFEVEQSPATTPSWKSNAWNRPAAREEAAGSPKLNNGDAVDETEWEEAGEQVLALWLVVLSKEHIMFPEHG